MMMRDIISMNPMPKPMFGGLLSKKSKSLWSANKISIPRVAERPQEQDNPGLPAPRVKVKYSTFPLKAQILKLRWSLNHPCKFSFLDLTFERQILWFRLHLMAR